MISRLFDVLFKTVRPLPLLLLAGCLLSDGAQPPSRFFTLYPSATEPLPEFAGKAPAPRPGIGPVRLAGYLDRPQLVTRRSDRELRISEVSLWAEPLAESFARALAANLAGLCACPDTAVFPWPEQTPVSHRIRLEILRFDSGPDRQARLQINWTVQAGKGGAILISRQSRFTAPVAGTDDEAVVAALSETTAAFSREVAQALAGLQ